MIKLGNTEISKVYLGGTEITKVYKGSDLVLDNSVAPLPYDAELQYLQSSGAQYIDLGKKATTSTKIEVKFSLSNTHIWKRRAYLWLFLWNFCHKCCIL